MQQLITYDLYSYISWFKKKKVRKLVLGLVCGSTTVHFQLPVRDGMSGHSICSIQFGSCLIYAGGDRQLIHLWIFPRGSSKRLILKQILHCFTLANSWKCLVAKYVWFIVIGKCHWKETVRDSQCFISCKLTRRTSQSAEINFAIFKTPSSKETFIIINDRMRDIEVVY